MYEIETDKCLKKKNCFISVVLQNNQLIMLTQITYSLVK